MSLDEILASLKAQAGDGRRAAPVELWNPTYCGEAGFEIRADGTWVHEGVRITREAMVRLFASILRKDEDGRTYLITPVEKILVKVEDAPFLAVRADRQGEGEAQNIIFTTNVGDVVCAKAEHPIRVSIDQVTKTPRPYLLVRGRLEARILRAQFLDLVEWSTLEGGKLLLWSGGVKFELGSV